ncbi:MAG TPA: EAL domain-containing protein [Rhodocyclaceae bacterium]|nr:EAL domain-containing protein [Rhodocyclaceae bacterium]
MTQIHKQENAGHGYARLRRQLSIRHWFTIAIGLICLIGYSAYDYYAQWRRSEEYLQGMVRLADEHLSKTVSETQLALSHLAIHIGRREEPSFADQAALRALLAQEMPKLPYLRTVSVVNAKGKLVASTRRPLLAPVDVGDRDYFRNWMADRTSGGMYVGSPIKPRLAGSQEPEWLMPFSLPIRSPGGAILGVVVATIDPDYFGRLYISVDPDRRTQIAVMRSDGIVMARVPYVEGQVGNSVAHGALFRDGLSRSSEGVLRHRSVVDGSDRLSAFRRLDEWPLVLMVGLGGNDINREWVRGTAYFAILPLLFMAILTRMHFRHRRQLQLADASNQALKENEQRFRSLFDEAPVGHIVNRLSDGRFVAANPAFCAITGYTAAELARLTYQDITPASHAEDDSGQLEAVGSTGRYGPYRKQFIRKDGSRVAVRLSGSLISSPDGEPQALSVVEDISGYQQAENRIRLLASVFDHSGECLMVTDHENRIVEVNHAFTTVTGYTPEEVIGQNPRILASGRSCPAEYRNMWESIKRKGSWQGEVWDRHKDGHVYPKWLTISVVRDEEGRVTHHIGSFTDITERKAAEERIHYLAHHDALTQLPNRFHLHGRLDQALAMAHREARQAAVMFIDMDRFKDINDTLGHHVGDFLLVEVAQRLRESVRESDIVARLGGDEFVVVLSQVDDAAVPVLADKLLHRLGEPYRVADQALHSTPSIGISLYPKDGESVEELMKNADTAMYHAKAMGRNNYQFFAAAMNEATAERLALEGGLRRALERGEFQLHYQPQVDVASGRVVGVEALVRWRHPDKGLVPPMKFVPVAEDTGLILPLGRWVIGEALAQLAAWRRDGIALERMAVNLSAHQLRDASLQEFIISQLARHGLDGRSLELEITESVAMQHPECTIAFLNALRAEGIELAIDDFGTGYSSLAYLKRLPLDRLKLDRSFVMDIEHDSNDATISAATISLAHSLGLAVVAEGVETTAQLDFLRGLECDFAQGYHFSRPLPAAECTAFMRREMADAGGERG